MTQKPTIDQLDWGCDIPISLKHELLAIARVEKSLSSLIKDREMGLFSGVIYFIRGVQTICFAPYEGTNMVGTVLGPGDWVGALSIGASFQLFVLTEEVAPVHLLYFPGGKLKQMANNDSDVYKWLFHIAQKAQSNWMQANLAAMHDKRVKTAYALLEFARRQASATVDKTVPMIKVSQDQLASVTGLSRSRLNEVLRNFEKAGEVKLGRGQLQILDMSALASRLHEMNTMFHDPRKV
ncbi:Crp/Fnr family transcriptional regulator [Corallincola luteus]|uniref:Crp/Fnr family transcriptional regulator n=1 Tax=Corallincola luteus TaxID=1775177 RepID=A0ABY2ASC2_9GAMM|nr:Crp/Fnr family transcriptional regulator [Corallincola luteus]TCI05151.1 Crp/Fnr family transcriptional regulator [Corallincola luteus]